MSTTPESPQDPPQGGYPPPPPPPAAPPAGAGGSHAVPPPSGYPPPDRASGYPPRHQASGYPPGQAAGYTPPVPPPYPADAPGHAGPQRPPYPSDGPGHAGPPRPPYPADAPEGHLPGYVPGAPLSPSDQRLWAVLSHVLTLLVGFFAPLVIWLVFKGRGAFSEDHSRESLNFQITMTIAAVGLTIFGVLTLGLGFLLLFAQLVVVVVLVILASVKASQGEPYRYPLTYRFIK